VELRRFEPVAAAARRLQLAERLTAAAVLEVRQRQERQERQTPAAVAADLGTRTERTAEAA
jgi:hypothetical protein